jgi:predicted signal transduction protein with EAL and GGDEF domain
VVRVTIEVGASVGIAVDAVATTTVDDLLGNADVAMYRARAMGKGRHHRYDTTSAAAQGKRAGGWVERGAGVRVAATATAPASARLEPEAG